MTKSPQGPTPMERLQPRHRDEAQPTEDVRSVEEVAGLDAALRDDDWPIIQQLWRAGVTNEGIYRLLRLRLAHQQHGIPSMDGFVPDARARFARWLVQAGH